MLAVLFPHANGGELFLYMSIAIRGIVAEKIYLYMCRKEGKDV